MARTRYESLTTIRSEGGLLPAEFLRRVGDGRREIAAEARKIAERDG